jgi:hypothetical protein
MILPDALERFGPLSEAIQAKGAIALAQIARNRMHLDVDRLAGLRVQLEENLAGQVDELLREPRFEGVLRLDRDGQIILTKKGQAPSLSQTRLRELLVQAAKEVEEDTGRPVRIARTEKGKVSLKAEDWEELAPFDSLVHAWIELGRTTKTLQFFRNLTGPVVRPSYTPLKRTGRTSCSNPNIQQLPRKGGLREAFVASPGHVLLIADYSFVELRTLAAECEARYGSSKLAEVIRAGVDPHAYTASMFEHISLDEFMTLKTSEREEDRDRYDTLRQRAKVLNFGIPGGLGPRSLVAYAKSTYGVTLTLEEATEFRRRLIEEVYPELGLYLADDSMESLAWNLGVPVKACWRRFDWKGDRSGAVGGGIRNVVRGRTCKADGRPYDPRFLANVWDGLVALNRNPELAPLLAARQGSDELFRRLFHSGVTTLTGRVRGRVGFTQARNTPFQGLASDGAKFALWALIRAGYRVVAFIHDEIVIELPENGVDHAAEARRIAEIMNVAMEQVTGAVPVACDYALSRRWSKEAKAVFHDGKLVPCEIDLKGPSRPAPGVGDSHRVSRGGSARFDSDSRLPIDTSNHGETMATNSNTTPMTTAPTEHDQPPTPDRRPTTSPIKGVSSMNKFQSSSDRDRDTATEPSADGGPDDGPSDDLSDGRDAAGNVDQLEWLLATEDDETFTSRVFQDFEERLAELSGRIVVVLKDGRLEAGRRQALLERLAGSRGFLVDLADAVETDLGRCAP